METNKPRNNPSLSLNQNHTEFIENQNNCTLCGHQLDIEVESYLEDYTLKEEAFCPKCDIKTRVKNHKMH